MPQKKHKPEEIVAKLHQVNMLSRGRPVAEALLYSGLIGQLPLMRIPARLVNGPVELLLLSEVDRCRLMMGSEGVGGAI